MTRDFLFELGCEELPAGQLPDLATHLQQSMSKGLAAHKISFGQINVFYTPRRLALMIEGLQCELPAQTMERRGPAKVVGFDAAGQPTPALLGFLKSAQATLKDLIEVETDKGMWLAVSIKQPAISTATLLPGILTQAIKTMPLKKLMRWGDQDVAFLRPVAWMVALLGEEVVPLELFGLHAGRTTRGHRFHHPEALELSSSDVYLKTLHQAYVMVDPAERRHSIQAQSQKLLPPDMYVQYGTLDEVINLVEWPVALLCQFNPAFLDVPERALIATMEVNQRVFPVRNQAGQLQPYFITIANISSKQPQEVIEGNEKVVSARLADARFFYQEDLKAPLEKYVEALQKITFQQGLGSLWDKTQRIERLAVDVWQVVDSQHIISEQALRHAAQFCKMDLPTQMVQEFPELQGYMGGQYALARGDSAIIAEAIEDHYKPKVRGGELPRSLLGAIIALADKIDTLKSMFENGKKPSSSGDPFALRRQAIGVIQIIIQHQMPLQLNRAPFLFNEQNGLRPFIVDRLQSYAEETYPEASTLMIQAICNTYRTEYNMDKHNDILIRELNLWNFAERLLALSALLQDAKGASLLSLFKRIKGLLKSRILPLRHSAAPGDSAEEIELDSAYRKIAAKIGQAQNASEQLLLLLDFEQPIASFFETVNVMDGNAEKENKRLYLLSDIANVFYQQADFSVL